MSASRTRTVAVLLPVVTLLATAACSSHGKPTTAAPALSPSVAPSPNASAAPKQYFADGKVYQAWIIAVKSGPSLTLDLAHHLVDTATSSPATKYLADHSASPGLGGIPNDYIDVDTHVHKSQPLSESAQIKINPEATNPEAMTVAKFLDWLKINEASPIPKASPEDYFGQPSYAGPLFEVRFKKDVIVSLNQVFEP
jgi:hypothetical protein